MDNNTWNNSHIALVGKAMSSNESAAYEIMTELDVDYVLGNFYRKIKTAIKITKKSLEILYFWRVFLEAFKQNISLR